MTFQPSEIYLKYKIPLYGYVTIIDIIDYSNTTKYCVRIHIDDKEWTYKDYKTLKGAKCAVTRIIKEYMFDYELKDHMCGPIYESELSFI